MAHLSMESKLFPNLSYQNNLKFLLVSAPQRKYLRNKFRNQCFSVLPKFVPLNEHEIYFVNESTDQSLLHDLIKLAQNTKYFAIDTESDRFTYKPSLIQIEMVHEELSTVLVFEMCHLPKNKSSLQFWLIRSLFKFILQPSKIIYSWDDAIAELKKFIAYGLFTKDAITQPTIIDLQLKFKEWYISKHHGFNPVGNEKWSLQYAVVDTFQQFLNKHETLNKWSRGLYRQHDQQYTTKLVSMIEYAVGDCLAVTKLAYVLGEDIGSKSKKPFFFTHMNKCFSF